jgi:DNA-binding MarR family transcriptional regulator
MDAYLSYSQNRANNFDPPPILIAADTEAATVRARATIAAAGLRIGDAVGIEEASARLERQAAASALWLELDGDFGSAVDQVLERVAADASEERYCAVVAVPASQVDRLGAFAFEPNIDVILDATEDERIAALAVAVSEARKPRGLSDVGADKSAARLRQLSDEVSRIAATLARLSTGPAATPRPVEIEHGELPDVPVETIRAIIRGRRLRSRYFSEELFADPAWDMLLDLLQAEISTLRVPVSSLCIAAAVPATTALRWLKTMTQEGLFVRRADPHDGRRVFVELAPHTSQALRRYFAEIGHAAVV